VIVTTQGKAKWVAGALMRPDCVSLLSYVLSSLPLSGAASIQLELVVLFFLEVKCEIKTGVVLFTNIKSAFKLPSIVCNPVKLFAEFTFAVISNVVCNSFNNVLRLTPSLIILLQVKFLNVKSDIDVNIFILFICFQFFYFCSNINIIITI